MKDMIKYSLLLFIVGSICASLVIVAYNFARPVLNEREQVETKAALDKLYAEQNYAYEDVTSSFGLDNVDELDNLYHVNSNGEETYIYKITVQGKNGNIVYLIEINLDGIITDIAYISQKETPGRGDKITLPDFTSSVIGSSYNNIEVDTISGATISSEAVISSLEIAVNHFESEVK